MSEDTILKVDKLSKRFGLTKILDDVSLDINKGEIFGIIGASGSGKTTLLKLMVGFLIPERGDVLFKQKDIMKSVYKNAKDAKYTFGFAAQEPSFYLKLKLRENLDHFGSLYGLNRDQRKANSDELLKIVNLQDYSEELAVKLSGGMRKRLGLITATIHDPPIYVLDEPTADLDHMSRKRVINMIKTAKEKEKTVVIASHLLDDLEILCDRIAVVHKGKVIKIGTPEELKQYYIKHKIIEIRTKSRDYEKIIMAINALGITFEKVNVVKDKLVIYTRDLELVLCQIFNAIQKNEEKLDDINIIKPTLNEMFDQMMKDD